ncbi:Arc family DNA-binding protein [Comamonas aquatica]|uniref:Arc family DNA-binding protein n=1 Tax=Comamonas aquatica TaxID=225991 RepID=UPI002447DF85|nr:Arc family DNA-binding protein [Comamonas aquatica]MDH0900737.1 Arc family DNA-binding protein [Comamonas aquatica]
MSREDPQMKIRLPADLKDQIEAAAKDSGRSMNAEIVARLERTFAAHPSTDSDARSALLEYEIAANQVEALRLQQQGRHFARAAESLVSTLKQWMPEAAEKLSGHLAQLQFFANLYPPVPESEISLAIELQFLMDKRRALLRQLALGNTGDLFSYPTELAKVDAQIAALKAPKQHPPKKPSDH